MRRLFLSAMFAVVAAQAADVSGTWNVTVQIQGNTGSPTFVLKQSGEALTGTYSGQLGDAPITGTIHGDKVEWSFEAKGGPIEGKIVYRGTVTGTTMKGTATFASAGEGTWEGTRK